MCIGGLGFFMPKFELLRKGKKKAKLLSSGSDFGSAVSKEVSESVA